VQFANPSETNGKISLFTLTGRKISEEVFSSGTKNVSLTVGSSGVYISEIAIGSNRIIKQTIVQ